MSWVSQNHDGEDGKFDQEIDLGGGWWAAVGPDTRYQWKWDLYDHWNIEDPSDVVAEGRADTEEKAKRAAVAMGAWLRHRSAREDATP